MMEAVLSNADHPEYGVATIPLPIPRNQYDHCVSLLEALEIGDASEADCRLDSLDSAWPVLNRLVCTKVNLDELDYLAKRLDSFTVGEFSQFQAMAEKLNLTSMKDLINLTFCCQQATVITDFTNLKEVGRDHYMNIHGGCASMEELEQLDGVETAVLLIEDNEGTITRYGVVYDNGMQLSQLYDGKHLPCYHYEADMTAVGISSRWEPENSRNVTWIYLVKYRNIDRSVVAHFAREKLLYEDADYHNAVFVGTDEDGVPRHAHKRSANSFGKAFRLNVEGCDPRHSFHHIGTDGSLYVFEAPIDMLSYITLHPEDWQRHSYVACCGTSIQPVAKMLERMPQIHTVLLCLDNDEAGHLANQRMMAQLEADYTVERLVPENKDWNDDLTTVREQKCEVNTLCQSFG